MILKLAWRNLWRNKKRSIITITSIAVAVFLAVFMRSMQLGMYDNMIKNVVGSYAGYVQIHDNGFWEEQNLDHSFELSEDLANTISSTAGVQTIVPRLQSFSLASSADLSKAVLLQGVEMDKEQQLVDWNNRLKEGRLFTKNEQSILLAKGVAHYFKKDVGDTLVLIGQGYHGMSAAGKYSISGIVDMKNPKINDLSVFMPLSSAQDYLSAEHRITNLVIAKDERADTDKLATTLRQTLDKEQYEIMTWKEMMPELQQTIIADSVGGLIMVFILYMIIVFGIFGTVLMMTQERIYELGVMVSIGMKKWMLARVIILETLILSLIGILSGIVMVMPFVYYFHSHPIKLAGNQAEVMEKFGFESTVPMLTDFNIPLTHALVIFSISMLIALYPTLTILNLNPIKAMKR